MALCCYIILLLLFCGTGLLGERTFLKYYVNFDSLYYAILILQSFYGIFLLPYLLLPSADGRVLFGNCVSLFWAGLPFAITAAFATATPWYGVVLSQILVFALWSLSCMILGLLKSPSSASVIYLSLAGFVFFGLLTLGLVLDSLLDNFAAISMFSVPGALNSWSSGQYFNLNGWFGVLACLGALVFWSIKLTGDTKQ